MEILSNLTWFATISIVQASTLEHLQSKKICIGTLE